jgi:hypothetical protein
MSSGGYFGSVSASDHTPPAVTSSDPRRALQAEPPPRRPADVAWGRILVAIAVLAVLGWAAGQPGGVEGQADRAWTNISGVIERATGDPDLRRASEVYNTWYERSGSYPQLTAAELDEAPEADWGVGVDVSWCSPRHVVLESLSSRGTLSRLLVDGKVRGDVNGEAACPLDLAAPAPWK